MNVDAFDCIIKFSHRIKIQMNRLQFISADVNDLNVGLRNKTLLICRCEYINYVQIDFNWFANSKKKKLQHQRHYKKKMALGDLNARSISWGEMSTIFIQRMLTALKPKS